MVHALSRIVHEDLCGRLSLRIAHLSALVVLEQTEDILTVEVDGEHLSVLIAHFKGGSVQLVHSADCVSSLTDSDHGGRNEGHSRNAGHERQSERQSCATSSSF